MVRFTQHVHPKAQDYYSVRTTLVILLVGLVHYMYKVHHLQSAMYNKLQPLCLQLMLCDSLLLSIAVGFSSARLKASAGQQLTS